ncbi:MAG: hypothetical protein M1828_003115 [Chrysothrix sp. TS-e1954]|nr:MAG: hypothetical protein M1828_003115 [Chrysothrix sp. TS-e1954]
MPNRYTDSHTTPKGAGDARPTADQIVHDENLDNALSDKVFLVTGTSSGIGIHTAKALALTGARVFCTVRDMAKGQKALADVLKPGRVELLEMENESLASVRQCARTFLDRSGGACNVLVCNAGVMGCPESKTKEGFERTFGTNHLAHFLLFQLLKDALISSSTPRFNSRVVCVSSMGHTMCGIDMGDYNWEKRTYDPQEAYGQAKTANIYMANEIERLYASRGLHATSLHPGGIWTGLQQYAFTEEVKAGYMKDEKLANYMKSPEQGAATSVLCAVGKEWEGKGGKYLEDCDVAPPAPDVPGMTPGVAKWAFDQQAEETLWKASLGMVGLPQESMA